MENIRNLAYTDCLNVNGIDINWVLNLKVPRNAKNFLNKGQPLADIGNQVCVSSFSKCFLHIANFSVYGDGHLYLFSFLRLHWCSGRISAICFIRCSVIFTSHNVYTLYLWCNLYQINLSSLFNIDFSYGVEINYHHCYCYTHVS